MYTIAQHARQAYEPIAKMLDLEPKTRPDFSQLDMVGLVTVMLAIIDKGAAGIDADGVFTYLNHRGCAYDRSTVNFLLNQYTGKSQRHCLWTRSKWGAYWANI